MDMESEDFEVRKSSDSSLMVMSRKAFLRSYPLLWDRSDDHEVLKGKSYAVEVKGRDVVKALQRKLKRVVMKIIVLKKLKEKLNDMRVAMGMGLASSSCASSSLHATQCIHVHTFVANPS